VNAHEIADLIDNLQATYASYSTALLLLNFDETLQLLELKGFDPGSTVNLGRRNNTKYSGIRLWDSIKLVRGSSNFNLNYLGSIFMIDLSWIGHELSLNHYFDQTPELELFRHLRNGISHGNTFNLLNGEPRRLARFNTFEITPALHGQPVLFEFISTGDLFDLFDQIKSHLRSLP
jgi:hypothetical protein